MNKNKFIEIIKEVVNLSGGSVDRINLKKFMNEVNDSFLFPWNRWLGTIIQKSPLDLMILHEIIFEKRPDTIIECGTCYGGSAYYMATLMDLMNIDGRVITIDHHQHPPTDTFSREDPIMINGEIIPVSMDLHQGQVRPKHPKIKYIHSDCLTAIIPELGQRTMVILDCDHSPDHVYLELERYSKMVTVGQYLIVEDTIISDRNDGPSKAIERFIKKNNSFTIDKTREKFGVSSNHEGYLLRVS